MIRGKYVSDKEDGYLEAKSRVGGGGGTPLYQLYRYVRPQRV